MQQKLSTKVKERLVGFRRLEIESKLKLNSGTNNTPMRTKCSEIQTLPP
jgi:hypothetical protein